MKTLISWIAQKNDFENGQFKPNGPTGGFHKYFYKDHDRHIVLSGGEQLELQDLYECSLFRTNFTDIELKQRYYIDPKTARMNRFFEEFNNDF
jgi:hypothetical protein